MALPNYLNWFWKFVKLLENIGQLLELKYRQYAQVSFIDTDPIAIPHRFTAKEDIEIAGFLSASLAWGSRPMIVRSAAQLIARMDNAPADFIRNARAGQRKALLGFVYRTFQDADLLFFVEALHHFYTHLGGLEAVFTEGFAHDHSVRLALVHFRKQFLAVEHLPRSEKHVANVLKKSSAKRLNMFLRWMVRPADEGIDFGLWKSIPTSALQMPLDLHSAGVARKLGLLNRSQTDWTAVEELTQNLAAYDANDPVKYDFALFGMGIFEKYWM